MSSNLAEDAWAKVLDDQEAKDSPCRACHGRGTDRWDEDCEFCGGLGVDFLANR